MPTEQLQFPFASLDFPGRTLLYPHEIAGDKGRLGMSMDHFHDLVSEGVLVAIDIASPGAVRRELRVPIESYRDFIVARMTGPRRREFLTALPEPTRTTLIVELFESLQNAARPALLRALRAA
ncbi:MAG: hypothetical protein HZA93_23735 [Verrucomicrobia bacterium]|nr:hypothetical protein [Verrucomicrobiota bacterium]